MGRPEVTYRGPRGQRDGSELLSLLQRAIPCPGNVLDLGCGPRDQKIPVESLGHRYVGVDYSSSSADLLADAHALPFVDAAFDGVLSFAVLEHLHNPFRALAEVARVLKPGGVFCGTVSQGEPFHDSYFHHTAWGILSVCQATGLRIHRLWACWDTLDGLGDMARYPRAIRLALRALSAIHRKVPVLAPRKMRWPNEARLRDELHRAASIGFETFKQDDQAAAPAATSR